MARRPGFPTEQDFEGLTLRELEVEIRRVTILRSIGPDNAYFRKLYESRLHKLNKLRERRLQESD